MKQIGPRAGTQGHLIAKTDGRLSVSVHNRDPVKTQPFAADAPLDPQ